MRTYKRQDQLGEVITRELSDLMQTRMKDPRVGFASITGVTLSPDLRYAKVYISVMGEADEQQATMRALHHASGFLRHELAQRLTIRYVPEIAFYLDQSIARGARVLELLHAVGDSTGEPGATQANDPAADEGDE